MMSDDFLHFLEAQEQMYAKALAELQAGKKQSHWMWYIFPQTPKPGMGEVARRFALRSVDEAGAYLEHEILGERLLACTRAVLSHKEKTLEEIFGSELDVRKFISSMHLFKHVDKTGIFKEALDKM